MNRDEMVIRLKTLLERLDNFEPEEDSAAMLLAHFEEEIGIVCAALTDGDENVVLLTYGWHYGTLGPNEEWHSEIWADQAGATRRRDWLLANESRKGWTGKNVDGVYIGGDLPPHVKLEVLPVQQAEESDGDGGAS